MGDVGIEVVDHIGFAFNSDNPFLQENNQHRLFSSTLLPRERSDTYQEEVGQTLRDLIIFVVPGSH